MRTKSLLLSAVLLLSTLPSLHSQKPVISRLNPMSVAPGRTTTLTIAGENLSGTTEVWTSFASRCRRSETIRKKDEGSGSSSAFFEIEVPASVPAGVGAIRVVSTGGVSSWHLIGIDPFSTIEAVGTNDQSRHAQALSIPSAVQGRARELESQFFQLSGSRGQRLFVDVVANRLGSAMDPLLRVVDAQGREIALVEDTPGLGADVAFNWKLPRTGEYRIELRDTLHRGGESFRYRLRVDREALPGAAFQGEAVPPLPGKVSLPVLNEVEPNDTGTQAQAVTAGSRIEGRFNQPGDRDVYQFRVEKNQRLVFAGRTRSLGSAADLFLQVAVTNGSVMTEANVSGANEGTITNTFKEAGTYLLLVEELNRGGPGQPYQVDVQTLSPGFALSVNEEALVLEPGGKVELPVSIERRDFSGVVRLELAGLPVGFAVTNNVIQEKAKDTKLQIIAPADLRAGDWFHFAVRGRAGNEGQEMRATASTVPALRNLWPRVLYPPQTLDGCIALGVTTAK